MAHETRTRLVISTAINMLVELNEVMVENARKGHDTELRLPRLFDRAFLIHHEAGVVPMVDRSVEG